MKSFVLFCSLFFLSLCSWAQESCTLELEIKGAIGVSVSDYIERAIEEAQSEGCDSILILINTPGGSLQSTRLIVEDILASPVPFLCLVYPGGAHAGSAGAIILQACHVNGALPTTNIGAATPIMGQGQDMAEDLRKKVINDTVSWLEGIAKKRGRNLEFVRDIVTEAKAVDAEAALEAGAIDTMVGSKEEFLEFAKGRKVKLQADAETEVVTGALVEFSRDLRFRILDFFGDPSFAYLLLMGSLALLYFEITNPGTIVPGVLGALGLVLSLITLHKLDVWWGGLTLMGLGIALMIAEAFIPSFGILGLGGMAAFAIGSVLLFDMETTGFSIPLALIIPVTLVLGLVFIGMSYLALRSLKLKKLSGKEGIIGKKGQVRSLTPSLSNEGQAEIWGELWRFKSKEAVHLGSTVVVDEIDGLTVWVHEIKKEES